MNFRRVGLMLVTVFAASLATPPAVADPPTQQGWWTATNPATGIGSLPAPSDVPSHGLLVQGSATSPTAYSALLFELPKDATVGSLTLNVASGSVSTPMASLQVCALVHPSMQAEEGGSMADAPAFDCATHVDATPDSGAYHFSVAPLVKDATLAVAVLGSSATDRVVLAPPDANTLAVQSGSPTTDASSSAAIDQSESPTNAPPFVPGALDVPPPIADLGAVPAPTAQPPLPQIANPGDLKPALAVGPEPGTRGPSSAALGAAAVAVLTGLALWSYAGHPDITSGTDPSEAPGRPER